MFVIVSLCCLESSVVPLSDGHDQIFVGADLGRKLVTQHLDNIKTGKKSMRVAYCQSLLGEKEVGNEHQSHVVMPGQPATNLIVGHAAGAHGILEGPLDEEARGLHGHQVAQRGRGLRIWTGST